jgi:hypothetical protein
MAKVVTMVVSQPIYIIPQVVHAPHCHQMESTYHVFINFTPMVVLNPVCA